jgi:nucleoside-diphosphate-sugar epimerase
VKALVTGATGFLGRAVVQRLQREGVIVRALVRPGRTCACDGVELCEGDLCSESSVSGAVRDVDWVVHAGARVVTTGKWEEFAEANIRATRRVIRAARAAGVQRIVHISSLSVYDVPRDDVTITEDSPYESESDARGPYSRSKLAADRSAFFEAARGAPVTVLRPGLLYGPGRRPPLARQSVQCAGCRLILATPGYTLPLSYVDNVADAVLLALTRADSVGKAFTIVDENVPQREYATMYRNASGEHWWPLFLPVGAIKIAVRLLEAGLGLIGKRSPVTYHQLRRATDSAWYDRSRAESLLGWRPAVSVREGLSRTFASLHGRQGSSGVPAVADVSS